VAAQTQLALDQIRTKLGDIRTALLADEDGGLDAAARAQKQAEIDAAIADIELAAGTQINGRRLLDGSANFRVSGRDHTQLRSVDVLSLRASEATLSGEVLTAAAQAELTYTGTAGNVSAGDTASFTLTGKRGAATIETTAGEALTDVRDRINAASHQTGIIASAAGDVLTLVSVDYGENATLEVDVDSGSFAVSGGNGDGTAQGTNARVTINGRTYSGGASAHLVDGNHVTYRDNSLAVTIEFAAGFIGEFDAVSISDDTALKFALTPQPAHITKLGIPGVQAARLGGLSGTLDQVSSGGDLSGLDVNVSQAIRVVDEAIVQLASVEGRVDGFANAAVASSADLMSGLEDELEDTLQSINGVNEEEEQILLAKNQALASNALSALHVLHQQRSSLVDLIKLIAGLG
jgi:flagellin-like hook-associated protein FlgL